MGRCYLLGMRAFILVTVQLCASHGHLLVTAEACPLSCISCHIACV